MKAKKEESSKKSSKISSKKKGENFQKHEKMLKKMGFVWEEGGRLDWRNLEKRARLQQEYEAIEDQRVATVEILIRKRTRLRQKNGAIEILHVATVGIQSENVISSSNI